MKQDIEYFGRTHDGDEVQGYLLENSSGLSVRLINYGAIVQSVKFPGKNGDQEEVSLGFDRLEDYLLEHPYFGATIGRYGNRIAGGEFSLGGETYKLAVNNGPNHLHGGLRGFDKVLWEAEGSSTGEATAVRFNYSSPDGDEGYPGRLDAWVTYSVDEGNRLIIEYEARSSAPTPVNLTNHTYWNLSGAGKGDILGHELTLVSENYLPVDENLIPTGELAEVEGRPMDFRSPVTIGERIGEVEGGYDHCYVLGEEASAEPRPAAILLDPLSGRCMRVSTTEPGLQLYTGNFLDGIKGAGGETFERHGALCLEAQHFPDSPNCPGFPSTILSPGETYRQVTLHEFSLS